MTCSESRHPSGRCYQTTMLLGRCSGHAIHSSSLGSCNMSYCLCPSHCWTSEAVRPTVGFYSRCTSHMLVWCESTNAESFFNTTSAKAQIERRNRWRKVFKFLMSLLPSHRQADRQRNWSETQNAKGGWYFLFAVSLLDTQKREMLMHLNENK